MDLTILADHCMIIWLQNMWPISLLRDHILTAIQYVQFQILIIIWKQQIPTTPLNVGEKKQLSTNNNVPDKNQQIKQDKAVTFMD